MSHLRITTLVENTALKRGHLAEHGLSFWIEIENRKILFDTGQGDVVCANARHFNIDLAQTDAIILSHGHYDHTGGLEKVLQLTGSAVLFTHPASFLHKYSRHTDGSVHEIGMNSPEKYRSGYGTELRLNEGHVEIFPKVHLTGFIPRLTDYENTGGKFFLDMACLKSDPLIDDQSAFIETPTGIAVILGCAHSGIINTLNYIRKLTNDAPIHTLIGGMHLLAASPERMSRTLDELKGFGLKQILPAHCTGFAATALLCREFSEICRPCNVGTVVEI